MGDKSPIEWTDATLRTRSFDVFGTGHVIGRLGKKVAGRTWDEFPSVG